MGDSIPPPRATWADMPTREERVAQLQREERATLRDIRRAYVGALLGCLFWVAVALALMAWAFHTTDAGWGNIAMLSALVVGYSGLTITLARFYMRGEENGWW